jgi:hypothetical protein
VLVGLLMYAIWPSSENEFVAGVSLQSQKMPGNVLGFILALYGFGSLTGGRFPKSE